VRDGDIPSIEAVRDAMDEMATLEEGKAFGQLGEQLMDVLESIKE
jgi:hypothetical protein